MTDFYAAFLAELDEVVILATRPAAAVVGECIRAAKRAQNAIHALPFADRLALMSDALLIEPQVLLHTMGEPAPVHYFLSDVSGQGEGPCTCGGSGWVEDENWQPEFPRQGRIRRNGIIPCGFCNEGGERG